MQGRWPDACSREHAVSSSCCEPVSLRLAGQSPEACSETFFILVPVFGSMSNLERGRMILFCLLDTIAQILQKKLKIQMVPVIPQSILKKRKISHLMVMVPVF